MRKGVVEPRRQSQGDARRCGETLLRAEEKVSAPGRPVALRPIAPGAECGAALKVRVLHGHLRHPEKSQTGESVGIVTKIRARNERLGVEAAFFVTREDVFALHHRNMPA